MRVLVTAGMVYGKLDDNKLVGNRARGLWAVQFAKYLVKQDHEVTLLVADTFSIMESVIGVTVVRHTGYHSYASTCEELALTHDVTVMSAAVVNWIPANPIKGKMPTKGYKEGDIIQIPFVLAPRVIDRMRKVNPNLILIGCKMLSGSTEPDLIAAARDVIDHAKCHVVVANDLSNLKTKLLVFPDGAVLKRVGDFQGLYEDLNEAIHDRFYRTVHTVRSPDDTSLQVARETFDRVAAKYRSRFSTQADGRAFGAIAVRAGTGWLVSGRRKNPDFTSADAVHVLSVDPEAKTLTVAGDDSASMNGALLIKTGEKFTAQAVLHLHEQLADVPTYKYTPPGTWRDNDRDIISPVFNIEHHGFVACLGSDLRPLTQEHPEVTHPE